MDNPWESLTDQVRSFCDHRDWGPYHTPKNLAIGLVTESSELLEKFRFLSDQESWDTLSDSRCREDIADEMADVLFFLLRFSDRTGISLSESLTQKLEKNAMKYPVEKAKGSNKKYTEF